MSAIILVLELACLAARLMLPAVRTHSVQFLSVSSTTLDHWSAVSLLGPAVRAHSVQFVPAVPVSSTTPDHACCSEPFHSFLACPPLFTFHSFSSFSKAFQKLSMLSKYSYLYIDESSTADKIRKFCAAEHDVSECVSKIPNLVKKEKAPFLQHTLSIQCSIGIYGDALTRNFCLARVQATKQPVNGDIIRQFAIFTKHFLTAAECLPPKGKHETTAAEFNGSWCERFVLRNHSVPMNIALVTSKMVKPRMDKKTGLPIPLEPLTLANGDIFVQNQTVKLRSGATPILGVQELMFYYTVAVEALHNFICDCLAVHRQKVEKLRSF